MWRVNKWNFQPILWNVPIVNRIIIWLVRIFAKQQHLKRANEKPFRIGSKNDYVFIDRWNFYLDVSFLAFILYFREILHSYFGKNKFEDYKLSIRQKFSCIWFFKNPNAWKIPHRLTPNPQRNLLYFEMFAAIRWPNRSWLLQISRWLLWKWTKSAKNVKITLIYKRK